MDAPVATRAPEHFVHVRSLVRAVKGTNADVDDAHAVPVGLVARSLHGRRQGGQQRGTKPARGGAQRR